MAIISIVTNTAGQGGAHPRRVKIITTDDLATVTTSGYLNQTHNNGYPMLSTDIVDMDYLYNTLTRSGTYAAFTVTVNGGNVTLTPTTGSGDDILPGTIGNVAVYSASQTLSDGGAPPIITSSLGTQTISVATTSATPTITGLSGSVTKTGSIMTAGSLIGLSGEVSASTTNGGEIYGVKGKITLTGTATGTLEAAAVYATLDIDSVDLSAAVVSVILADMGTAAEIGTFSELYGIKLLNGTESVANAQIYLAGGADKLLNLVDNSVLVGPTYFVAAGTTAGSAGDVTKCNASKVLTIAVNEVLYYIPLFASNA